jgi:hypothetical protein
MKTCMHLGALVHVVRWSTLTKGPLEKTLTSLLVALLVTTAMEVFSWNEVFLK